MLCFVQKCVGGNRAPLSSVFSLQDYKKTHEACREHVSSQWHKESVGMFQDILNVMEKVQLLVVLPVSSALRVQVDQNRENFPQLFQPSCLCSQAAVGASRRDMYCWMGIWAPILSAFRLQNKRKRWWLGQCESSALLGGFLNQKQTLILCPHGRKRWTNMPSG